MNSEWALHKLDDLQAKVDELRVVRKLGAPFADRRREVERELDLRKVPVRAIAEELFVDWRGFHGGSYLTSQIQMIRGEILFRAEIDENLQPEAPRLRADRLHPWIWSAAQSLWESGHHADAVETAAKKLNAEIQNKVQRRDVSDASLCTEVFNAAPPAAGRSRLRFPGARDSESWRSRQEGAMSFSRGAFMAIRNPLAHDGEVDLGEHEALELLSAFSVVARWVDQCEVECLDSDQASGETPA
ncbi:TIGR02391 family protein [Leifsonia sp. 2MCAF36]|uniref:TIGR02391 family protein n=1 Tax=Leifsonia sp. 2MCAF36 TaxID=3232988 RepID=UPI003F96D06F